jgi:hypothetical protein
VKQVLLRGAKAVVEDVPAPGLEVGQVLVRVAWSCVSPGTELVSAAETSRGNLVGRIRRNPAKARQAFKLLQEQGVRKFSGVIVGDVGLGIRRQAMYAKELDLVMSTS